jgi:hypothetical protein
VGDGKRARWKPTQNLHYAGSGYRHGKTHTNRRGSTSARQPADSGHVLTRFLNGYKKVASDDPMVDAEIVKAIAGTASKVLLRRH